MCIKSPKNTVEAIANSLVPAASLGSKPSNIIDVVSVVPPPNPTNPVINPPEKELREAINRLSTPNFDFEEFKFFVVELEGFDLTL